MQSKSEAQVSIIIINYNGLKFLPVCLDALEKIDYQDCQVILVDNASNDCSMDWLREYVKKNKPINFNLILNKHTAVIYHFIGGVASGSPNKKYKSTLMRRFMAERNNIRTLLKNYQIITLIFVMPLYFFINLLEIFIFVFSLKPKTALTYPRAWCWNIINLKNTLQHRAKIQQTRKISDFKIFKKMYLTSGKFLMFKKIGLPSFK